MCVGCAPGRISVFCFALIFSTCLYVHGREHTGEVRNKGVCEAGALSFLSGCGPVFKAIVCVCDPCRTMVPD